jgi:uncharacterized protein (TIGR03067 family)
MRVIVSVMAVFVLVNVGGAQDAIKKEMTQLEGEWSMVSGEANGQAMPKEMVKSGKRVAKDAKTTITMGGRVYFKANFTTTRLRNPRPSTT